MAVLCPCWLSHSTHGRGPTCSPAFHHWGPLASAHKTVPASNGPRGGSVYDERSENFGFFLWGVGSGHEWPPELLRGHEAPLHHIVPPALVRVLLPGTVFTPNVEDVSKEGAKLECVQGPEGHVQMTSDL